MKKKKIIIRADSSIVIGTGHVMRCLTLADELKSQGAEVTFITRAHDGNLSDAITERGHRVQILAASTNTYQLRQNDEGYSSWLGVSWEQDAEETIMAIGGSRPDWLVIDHYGIDARWHKVLRAHVDQIMVIDDLADRPLVCDILLDQTYGRNEDDYTRWAPPGCQLLLGSRFALLRPEFADLRQKAIEKRKTFNGINRVLVSMGGMDPANVTSKVLEGLKRVEWKDQPFIDVILGGKAPHLKQIERIAKESALKMFVSTDISDLAERMLAADLAIGAGGATSWERCCLGLPTLVISIAENQLMIVKHLHKQGSIQSLGHQKSETWVEVKEAVGKVLSSSGIWEEMSRKGFNVTDGRGLSRVLEVMCESH